MFSFAKIQSSAKRLQGVAKRWSSSQASTASVLRDRRLAGRRRFYKNVDIQALTHVPWQATKNETVESVQSPISAGVDGTDSASGVHRPKSTSIDSLRHYLTPRKPYISTPTAAGSDLSKKDEDINWYGITLDGRLIQTPMGQTLMVPSALWAAQIAAEWDSVESVLQPTQMPCMTLTCTVLDQTASHPEVYQDQVTRFVPTDTICYWADPSEDRVLHQQQEEAWRKIHDRVEQVTGVPLATVSGGQEGIMTAARGLPHNPVLVDYANDFCSQLDAWHLTAIQTLAVEAKSFWLAWALLTQHCSAKDEDDDLPIVFKEVADAVHASRVEEEFQIGIWGMVEGQHDYDRLNTSINVSAALLLVNSLATDCKL